MPRKTEPLTGGLVTDRDPALLKPGQLSDIRNMVYKNGAVGLERAVGRAVFGTVSATATGVVGLRDVHFDNGDHYLVAMAGDKYRIAPMGDTGTFADLATIVAGTSLEVVQYRNRFFLMNGASADASAIGTNLVTYLSATAAGTAPTTRQHGLLPVIAAPTVTTGAGSFALTVTGYYEYWTTEVAKLTQDGAPVNLEGAFSSDTGVTTVLVSALGVVPSIQRSSIRNSLTTHWRIYRSPKKELAKDKKFPSGFMIAELATGASSHPDSSVTGVSASSFPASANASPTFYFDFASASSMFADDGVYASASMPAHAVNKQQGLYAFSLGALTGNISGIVVEIQGYVSTGVAPVSITASIGKRSTGGQLAPLSNGGQYPPSKSGLISSTSSGTPTTLSLGGANDNWTANSGGSPVFAASDFDGNFMVVLEVSNFGSGSTLAVGIDYVKIYIYTNASTESTTVYPTVVYTFGDIVSQVSKNFPPPSSNTGDLYQDSLVVNDMSNAAIIRYSFPGEPESFPPTYFLDFETRENDQVRHIRVVNNRLVVGLDTSLWRVNYLPSERDASFDRGKATEMISRSFGIVNPMCACTFTIDGQTEQLAFVSYKGIHTTDGYNFITRTKNQTWRNFISLTSTSTPIALLNDPENRTLRFFYRNDSLGNETFMCLHLSYDAADIDSEGSFKVSGPVHSRNYSAAGGGYASVESAWAVPRSNGNTGIYIGYGGTSAAAGGGKVYFETGTAIPSNDDTAQWTSRRMYEAGLSGEWMLDDLYGYCGSYSGSPLLTYTFKGTKTNDTGETTRGAKTITLAGQPLHHVIPKVQCEGLRINMVASGAGTLMQEMIVLGSTTYGREDSGR
jgi:hypothetical protein